MITILMIWLIFWFMCYSIGNGLFNLVFKSFHLTYSPPEIEKATIGFFIVYVSSMICSMFTGVDDRFLYILCSLSVLMAFHFKWKNIALIFNKKRGLYFVNSLFFAGLLAFYASLPEVNYDTHLYHLNAVRVNQQFGTILGLSHFHFRFGFNNSFHSFSAIFENFILKGTSLHTSLGFLMFFSMARFLHYVYFSKSFMRLSAILMLGLVLRIAWSREASSLSTDHAFSLLFCNALFNALLIPKDTKASLQKNTVFYHVLVFNLFCALAFTVKLSGASLLFVTCVANFCLMYNFYSPLLLKQLKTYVFLVTPYLIILPHLIKNILLSGWLIYPVPRFYLNFEWGESPERVQFISDAVRTWGLPAWFLESTDFSRWFKLFWEVFPDKLFIALSLALLIVARIWKVGFKFSCRSQFKELILTLCFFSFFSVWFVGAPNLRFLANVHIYLEAIIALYLVQIWFQKKSIKIIFVSILAVWFARPNPNFMEFSSISSLLFPPRVGSSNHNLARFYCDNLSYEFYVPKQDDRCGNSPMPCTPYFNAELKYFTKADFTGGFYMCQGPQCECSRRFLSEDEVY